MIAKNLLSQEVSPLRTSDSGEEALTMMGVFSVRHLPIVNNEDFLGLIGEEDIYNADLEEAIGSYNLSLDRSTVLEDDHIFEIMSRLSKNELTVIPVVNRENQYLGVVTLSDIVHYYATSISFAEPGSIVVVEVLRHNYLLSEIARIIEQEGANILGTILTPVEGSNRIYVTLKINQSNIQPIIASLRRYEYDVKGSFYEEDYYDNLKDNYDALMKYLNV